MNPVETRQGKKLRIVHVVHAYTPAIGGTERLMQQVSEYLAGECGHNVEVYTTFAYNTALFTDPRAPKLSVEHSDEMINGVRVRRFPVINRWGRLLYYLQGVMYRLRLPGNGRARMMFYGPLSPAMKKAIREAEADIIVAAPFPLHHTSYVFLNRKKAPVILIGCIHTDDRHGFDNPRVHDSIRRAAGYVALTDFEKEFLVEEWGVEEAKIRVIGVGIDTVEEGGSDAPALRRRLQIPADAPIIAFVGQHGLHKGIETLLLAQPAIWRGFPETRLVVAGGTSPFSAGLRELARFIDPEGKRIYFMDNIDEVLKAEIIAGCDVFATPSGYESFGITILEAWKRRRPVTACRIPATSSLIEDYRTGILTDYKNAPELAAALLELLSDPELRRKVGEQGYEKLCRRYSREVAGRSFEDFYREVIARAG